jgi:hypothetical protein
VRRAAECVAAVSHLNHRNAEFYLCFVIIATHSALNPRVSYTRIGYHIPRGPNCSARASCWAALVAARFRVAACCFFCATASSLHRVCRLLACLCHLLL